MAFKKLVLSLFLAVLIIVITVVGVTYAYYVNSGGSVEVTTSEFDKSLGVVFVNNDYIDFNVGVPILKEEVDTKASVVNFTLIPSASVIDGYDVNVDIGLSNIEIDDELRVNSFKYKLLCRSSINDMDSQVFSGDATSFVDSSYVIASLSSTASGNNVFYIDRNVNSQSYNCFLYVWLEESFENQNDLMGKHFGANIYINSMMKKR